MNQPRLLLFALCLLAAGSFAYNVEDYEKPAGMIFRIMPHWQFAPYGGGGASYNQLFSGDSEEQGDLPDDEKVESTWAGHAEGGLRVWLPSKIHFFELYGRRTWSAAEAVGNYWTAGFGYGQNW